MGAPPLWAPAVQAASTLAQHMPPPHPTMMFGRTLGPAMMGLGLLAAFAGSARRSRPVVAAAALAVLAGAFSFTVPGSAPVFLLSLASLVFAAGFGIGEAVATRGSLAPPGNQPEMERLRLLHGRTHISCFAGDGAKSGLQVGSGVIGYEVRWGVAVAVGDPLIPASQKAAAVTAFLDLCDAWRWVPCFYQSDSALRRMYRESGFRLIKFGEEAVVEVDRFDLQSPARAGARHEVARARRAGLEAIMISETEAPGALWSQMQEVSRDWLAPRGGREMGFSLGRLGQLVDSATCYTAARDGQGRVHAFCSWVRMGDNAIALDLVRRRPDAGAGAVDLCIVTAIEQARAIGLSRVSLGAVPFRDALGDAPDGRLVRAIRSRLYERGVGGYRYRGLSHFKAKFATVWESRDLVMPGGPSFLLALAVLIRLHSPTKPPRRPKAATPLELGHLGTP